jgi:hypothetical protein
MDVSMAPALVGRMLWNFDQSGPEIEPDGMPGAVRWKSMARIGNWFHGSL